jgi:hypothetical protein
MSFKISDPRSVAEAMCDGPFALSWSGRLGTACFAVVRPDPQQLFDGSGQQSDAIVLSRVTMTIENWVAMRDLLNRLLPAEQVDKPPASGSSVH